LTDSQGNILCFNGEIFAGLDIPAGANDGKALLAALQQASAAASAAADAGLFAAGSAFCTAADTCTSASAAAAAEQGASARKQAVSSSPDNSSSSSSSGDSSSGSSDAGAQAIMGVLSRLRGPWSLIYWQEQQQQLWFGREVLGESHAVCAARFHTHSLVIAAGYHV
jgi:hypothetical protein